ncbi:hypothetical protein CHS0354_000767 [Potamilus streckersoni]|uniref:Protein translocase subunit SecA n=1 Tax=Potamilus streckersoni TaxID=2493646 RepID=A0AAE0W9E8_9BIVA|nr:hypothetical protein CHS0354_000767 [Potamilus streckersoni]
MFSFLQKIFGSKQDRDIKPLLPIVEEINQICDSLKELTDEELKGRTLSLKAQIREAVDSIKANIESEKESLKTLGISHDEIEIIKEKIKSLEQELSESYQSVLNDILPEAFAIVKETCRRLKERNHTYMIGGNTVTWDMVPYDVQLMGGIVLHQGKIAEMATGEGKTLVASLPTFLNALTGNGVHIVTVNDYLAKRDQEWMLPIYEFHELTTGVILNSLEPASRKEAYQADITFGTNNEYGFDYLRDNMAADAQSVVHRNFFYAIVDEVDSVLIDEARTPLIISGAVPEASKEKFTDLDPLVKKLVKLQQEYVSSLIKKADTLMTKKEEMAKDWEMQAGLALLRAKRGYPKNKNLIKILGKEGSVRLLESVENVYLRDNASRMHEVDAELYYSIDERFHSIDLTEKGREELSKPPRDKDFFIIPDAGSELAKIEIDTSLSQEAKQVAKETLYEKFAEKSDLIHSVSQLLKAYSLFEKDVEYVVQNGRVLIVDEFTGRILPGRRYSDGLHQAIEAKESVSIEGETQTMATITLQNYFRLYKKLSGMTGTAETEEAEFHDIYKLDVVVVPTNKPTERKDAEDSVYKTKREKYNAVINEIESKQKQGQPVLVGTTSVDVSEILSRMLQRKAIRHNVLNAKQHQREAEIISNAGKKGNVTIATNMAGRGTDIKLGEGVKELGGLFIMGTERHESRRIDRQLRGRSGRQGDPGGSQFYLSLEDDLMRLFGSDRISRIMDKLNHEEGEALQHSLVTKSIERAQKKIEEQNFATRKRLLEYDNVMNQQREIIYHLRRNALQNERLRNEVFDYLDNFVFELTKEFLSTSDVGSIKNKLAHQLGVPITDEQLNTDYPTEETISKILYDICTAYYAGKEERLSSPIMSQLEKYAFITTIDNKWREHLRDIEAIKEGVHLRAYAQKDPILEYKQEAFRTFSDMLNSIELDILELTFKLTPQSQSSKHDRHTQKVTNLKAIHADPESVYTKTKTSLPEKSKEQDKPIPIRVEKQLGRNEPCYCGSGKKFKQCHGK